METAKLKIEGMSCGHCVKQVTAALTKLPGVEVVDVTVGSAEVRLDPAKSSAAAVAAAVTAAGYDAAADEAGPTKSAGSCGTGCCGSKVNLTSVGGRSNE